jgi:hypothetical protein
MKIIVNDVETEINAAESTIYMLDCNHGDRVGPQVQQVPQRIKIKRCCQQGPGVVISHIVKPAFSPAGYHHLTPVRF